MRKNIRVAIKKDPPDFWEITGPFCYSCEREVLCKSYPNPLQKCVEAIIKSDRINKAQRICNPKSGGFLRETRDIPWEDLPFKPQEIKALPEEMRNLLKKKFKGGKFQTRPHDPQSKIMYIGDAPVRAKSGFLAESDKELLNQMGLKDFILFQFKNNQGLLTELNEKQVREGGHALLLSFLEQLKKENANKQYTRWDILDPHLRRGIILFTLFSKSGERPGGYQGKDIRTILGTKDSATVLRTRNALVCLGILKKQRDRYRFSGSQLEPMEGILSAISSWKDEDPNSVTWSWQIPLAERISSKTH